MELTLTIVWFSDMVGVLRKVYCTKTHGNIGSGEHPPGQGTRLFQSNVEFLSQSTTVVKGCIIVCTYV